MKKILMLITILIMAIASCSSPTAIKNNGGGSDINDNTSTNPPANNGGTGGGSGENPEPPTPEPDPEPEQPGGGNEEKPEVPTPEPEPQYQGLAKRLPQSIIGRKFVYISYGDRGDVHQHFEFVFKSDGSVNYTTYMLGKPYPYYNWNGDNPDMVEHTGASTETGFESSKINFDRTDTIRKFRVSFKKYDEGGNSSTQCVMFEFEFKNGNYNELHFKRSQQHQSGFNMSRNYDFESEHIAKVE